ncbi:MAG: quinone-interacting membrane-bound oxidoreductase complex subunit QmoC [Dissulfurimicrobium sp.]|uniref:quinone-interacting membrane-bound oxidoreductase complex subunit QmoC n=1 Tax=Dissulfurimicrobium hydrothermale TaxID=1750598 RepID=UPI001EDBEF4E|nr:quinone-interacting membrane-bound oxidoreductase complex subunit QmoC [Dissulfurimicrobium hydrothermale]UKL14455.1 quinone-interacting membrane-bound oxidoreductase complex subunit QmoC [Dissulfurimicrobium hydrothermale]
MAEYTKVQPDLSFVRNVIDSGGDTVKSCYQCATCSVVCPLSTPESPFPRKEMLWTQWGLADKVAGDVDVWLCHQCADCTVYCPRDARPGDVLGAVRASAIRYYAKPKALADMLSSPGGVIGAIIAAAVLVLVVAAAWSQVTGEGFPFPEGDVVYHKFLSVIPIDAIFLSIAAFVLFVCYNGVTNFWLDISKGAGLPTSYTGSVPVPPFGVLIGRYTWPAILEILSHARFKKCGQTVERARGHLWLLWAFIILFLVTNFVFIAEDLLHNALHLIGPVTPMPLYHPVKLLANFGAILMISGIWLIKTMRDKKTEEKVLKSSSQDWILIWLIFAVGATGIASEVFRLINVAQIAYPIYVFHLACVAVLFLSLPYTKFGHLVYRTTAYIFKMWADDVKAGKAGFGLEKPIAVEEAH